MTFPVDTHGIDYLHLDVSSDGISHWIIYTHEIRRMTDDDEEFMPRWTSTWDSFGREELLAGIVFNVLLYSSTEI